MPSYRVEMVATYPAEGDVLGLVRRLRTWAEETPFGELHRIDGPDAAWAAATTVDVEGAGPEQAGRSALADFAAKLQLVDLLGPAGIVAAAATLISGAGW